MVVVEVLTNNSLLAARALYHKCFFETYSSSMNICYDVLEGKSLGVRVAYRRFHFVYNQRKLKEKPGETRLPKEKPRKQSKTATKKNIKDQ